jgi:glucosamine--fructose-6-phosphate aminotransferase (isomerizing)
MCGIIGIIGFSECNKFIIDGLLQLQNRGYDSAGICTLSDNNEFLIYKYASKNNNNAMNLLKEKEYNNDTIGIGHTRWATHGPKTDCNSHPHMDMNNQFSLVHNGIIENFNELKNDLISKNYTFKSQTDTEVIVNLLAYENTLVDKVEDAIRNTISKLEGTYALCILNKKEQNKLYCVRHGSPLLISISENEALIVSEQSGFCNKANSYICLDNQDICILEKKNNKINISTNNSYNLKTSTNVESKLTPYPYNNWMIKEIFDQVESSKRAISNGGRLLDDNKVKLGGLESSKDKLVKIKNLILLGCGTSYFAGLTSIKYFKELCNFNTIQIFDGAEFNSNDIPKIGETALLLLSQSGETKDLHRCIKIGKDNNLYIIGVVNVVDSLIARESNCGCYLNAGREVAVASTKSFTSQVIILSMIAIWFSQKHNINDNKRLQYISDIRKLSNDISQVLNNGEKYKLFVDQLYNKNSMFILGKGNLEAIAKESSLKVKEVSYIHAEGYSGSSLKHGPFGLLEKDFPVILIDSDQNYFNKMTNVYEEVKSRHANVITISNNYNLQRENLILIPHNKTFSNILSVIPMQLISYEISKKKGINPDFPRNLAKVVTVE